MLLHEMENIVVREVRVVIYVMEGSQCKQTEVPGDMSESAGVLKCPFNINKMRGKKYISFVL